MFEQLERALHRFDRRRRLRDALLWLPRGMLAGLLLAALLATIARLRPLLTNEEVGAAAVGLAAVGILAAAVLVLVRRRTLLQQARFADRRFALQERVSTAVEIHRGELSVPAALATRQLEDTLQVVSAVDAQSMLPLRLSRRDWLLSLLAAALLAIAVWLPNPQVGILRTQRALEASIEEQMQEVEAQVEEIEENPALTEEQKESLAEPLQSALEELRQGDLTREEAVAVLSEAEADLRDLAATNSNEALRRELQAAGQSLSENAAGQSLGQSLQSGDLSQAGQAAADLAGELPQLSAQEQSALAQDLAQTAQALTEVDPQLARELAQAAQALQDGDAAAAQQALQEAAATLQQRALEQAAAQQAAAAAEQAGRGRDAVAQAGQEGQGQAEQEGQSTAEGSGNGQGQGSRSGQGDGQGTGESQGPGSGVGGSTGGAGGETGHAEDVYVPDFADLSDEPGQDLTLPAECIANPQNCGALLNERATAFGDEQSRVPYTQVYGDYRDAAYRALDEEPLPLGLKGYIRDYFSSLEPSGPGNPETGN